MRDSHDDRDDQDDEYDDSRRRRRRDEYDNDVRDDPRDSRTQHSHDDDKSLGGNPPYPVLLSVAGYMWMVLGALILIFAVFGVTSGNQAENQEQRDRQDAILPAVIGLFGLIAIVGFVFVREGIRSIKGNVRDAIGYGIGSIVVALFPIGAGAVMLGEGKEGNAAIAFVFGSFWIAAGALAIITRADYLDWKSSGAGRAERRSTSYFGDRDRD